MAAVSRQGKGILGSHMTPEDRNVGVDIALVEIKDHRSSSSSCEAAPIATVFKGDVRELQDKVVQKLGAMTPYTEGSVIRVNYRANIAGTPCAHCPLVKALGKTSEFAKHGDSGSLVVRDLENGALEVIGIVSKSVKKWKDPKTKEVHPELAVVVLLANCFEAIENKFGIKLKLCGKWENCNVLPLEREARGKYSE